MRKKSYIDSESKTVQRYSRKRSYIIVDEYDSAKGYRLLPEEYDMFSKLDQSLFTRTETRQFVLISACLLYMKSCLIEFNNRYGIVCILPKLIYSKDDEGTIIFSMALSSFRAYMSFEGEKGNYDAYYGIITQPDAQSISSETKILTLENYKAAILSFLQIVINNS